MIFDTPNCICNKYYTGNSLTKYKCRGFTPQSICNNSIISIVITTYDKTCLIKLIITWLMITDFNKNVFEV